MRNQRGMTLIEMLIAMTTFLIFLAGALGAVRGQLRGFARGVDESGILQNMRYGVDQLEQELRMAAANVPARQPALVYASATVLSFNADLVSNIPGDISAVYVDPTAPAGQVSALPLGSATAVPGSSPSFIWPQADFAMSPAETITFWFALDTETARADDYVLMRQVNNQPPERLMRQILANTDGSPFLAYTYQNIPVAGNQTLAPVPAGWLPLRHSAPQHGLLPDTGVTARIDLLRTVEVRYRVTDGRPGTQERTRSIRTTIAMPNVGVKKLQTCGDAPLFGVPILAVPSVDAVTGQRRVQLSWNASVDEAAGEQDVIRYVIWRRVLPTAAWGDPYSSIPSGSPTYVFPDLDVEAGFSYQYAVAVQDCTPSLSPRSFSPTAVVP